MAYRFSILLALNRGTTELTAGTLNLRGGPQPRIHVDVVKGGPKSVMTPEAPELGTLYYSVVGPCNLTSQIIVSLNLLFEEQVFHRLGTSSTIIIEVHWAIL